jgi:DNA-binding FrmR family transcriptional regulator
VAPKTKEKHWLLLRARRIRGQVEAIERALDSEQECGDVLNLVAACRGALNSLMFEVLAGHVRSQAMSSDREKRSSEARTAQELIDVIRRYLK